MTAGLFADASTGALRRQGERLHVVGSVEGLDTSATLKERARKFVAARFLPPREGTCDCPIQLRFGSTCTNTRGTRVPVLIGECCECGAAQLECGSQIASVHTIDDHDIEKLLKGVRDAANRAEWLSGHQDVAYSSVAAFVLGHEIAEAELAYRRPFPPRNTIMSDKVKESLKGDSPIAHIQRSRVRMDDIHPLADEVAYEWSGLYRRTGDFHDAKSGSFRLVLAGEAFELCCDVTIRKTTGFGQADYDFASTECIFHDGSTPKEECLENDKN